MTTTTSTAHTTMLHQQPAGYRPMAVGETVGVGDYMQIGNSYALVDHDGRDCKTNTERRLTYDCGQGGHVIAHGGERYWTRA